MTPSEWVCHYYYRIRKRVEYYSGHVHLRMFMAKRGIFVNYYCAPEMKHTGTWPLIPRVCILL